MAGEVNKALGDTVARTIIKLIVVSLIVGFVMAFFNVQPWDLIYSVRDFILDIWYSGFQALGKVGDYLVLGATIVIPIFILIRILNYRR